MSEKDFSIDEELKRLLEEVEDEDCEVDLAEFGEEQAMMREGYDDR